jgi:hypothetical protein
MPATPLRWGGATAAAGGGLLIIGWLININRVTLPGEVVILLAHAAMSLGVLALYARQAATSGALGLIGAAMAVIGSSLIVPGGAFWSSLAPEAKPAVEAATASGVGLAVSIGGALTFVLGYVLFGISCLRAGALPRGVGVLLISGAVLLFAGAGILRTQPLAAAGALLIGTGLAWAGGLTWARPRPANP